MLNVRNIIYTLKNGVRTVQISFKVTLKLSLAYITSFLPLEFTVLSRTLSCLCHFNLLSRSCLALVHAWHLSFWIISCVFFCPHPLHFPLCSSPQFLNCLIPRGVLHSCMLAQAASPPIADSQALNSRRGPGHYLPGRKVE